METIMKNLKLVWGMWFIALLIAVLGAFMVELDGGVNNRLFFYSTIGFTFAVSFFCLLAHTRKLNSGDEIKKI